MRTSKASRGRTAWLCLLVILSGCDETVDPSDAAVPDAATADSGVDASAPPFTPTSYCPGSAGCETGQGTFRVGASAVSITPTIDETTDVMTVDVDGDGEYDGGEDEFENRDGVPGFQGVWIAGFGNARPASGVADETWARAVALESGDTSIVVLALDVVGWFKPDMDQIRDMVADLGVDHIAVSATHTHQSRDTIGIWGIREDATGLDPAYNAFVRERAAQAVREAVGALQDANIQYSGLDLRDQGPLQRWVGDNRDPMAIDSEVRLMRFVEAGTDTTIATLVNFAAHPEYLDDENNLISSDLAHYIRRAVEEGTTAPDGTEVAGLGGVAVYLQGALGSQIGPNGLAVEAWDGTPRVQNDDVFAFTETVGSQIGYFILRALGPDGGSTTEMVASLGYRTREFLVDVQNRGFHLAISQGLFDRVGEGYDPDLIILPGENEPDLRTEVTVLDIGRVTMITAPGELDPLLFIGGYDGAYAPTGVPLIDPDNPNPPDLGAAPSGPYLRDLARSDADSVWLLGLTNDYLGYFVPEFDFVLHDANPYLDQAPGDHYEETNAVGVDGWPTVRRELEALLAFRPDGA